MIITFHNKELFVDGVAQDIFIKDPSPEEIATCYGIDLMCEQILAVANALGEKLKLQPIELYMVKFLINVKWPR